MSTRKPKPTRKAGYYGSFYWVAIVTFVVPLVVANKAFQNVSFVSKPTPNPDASGVDHALWDYLLKVYVEEGLVDYDGLSRDYLLQTYLLQLAEADLDKLSTATERLALLCNAYNAFVIQGVITHKITNSVKEYGLDGKGQFVGKGFFDVEEHILCGQTVSLNHIEHELIRKRYQDPRVHFALVCAARSCPSLRREAYTGKRLEQQLEDQSLLFANNPKYVAYDAPNKTLQLTPILKWYGSDWDFLGGYLPWLAERVKNPSLKAAVDQGSHNEIQATFFDYDWSLNTQTPGLAPGIGESKRTTTGFGSGTVPNQ